MKTQVAKISKETADNIRGQFLNEFSKFNPFEIDGEFYVSISESKFLKPDLYDIVEIEISTFYETNRQD